jgi:hypothetical protein
MSTFLVEQFLRAAVRVLLRHKFFAWQDMEARRCKTRLPDFEASSGKPGNRTPPRSMESDSAPPTTIAVESRLGTNTEEQPRACIRQYCCHLALLPEFRQVLAPSHPMEDLFCS